MLQIRIAMFLMLMSLIGCGGGDGFREPQLTEVKITVTLNNQPLPNAQVTLTPTETAYGPNSVSTGVTDEAGVATLMCAGKPGACVGNNRVTVSEGPVPDETRSDDPKAQVEASNFLKKLKNRPIPTKYATIAQTDLSIAIVAGQKDYSLQLKR